MIVQFTMLNWVLERIHLNKKYKRLMKEYTGQIYCQGQLKKKVLVFIPIVNLIERPYTNACFAFIVIFAGQY